MCPLWVRKPCQINYCLAKDESTHSRAWGSGLRASAPKMPPTNPRHRMHRMLRLTDLKLPLDHPEPALRKAILARLGIAADELTGFTVAKRSYDARRRGAIVLIYSVDVETPREADILRRLQLDDEAEGFAHTDDGGKVMRTPDTIYKFVAHAPDTLPLRPLVIGMG